MNGSATKRHLPKCLQQQSKNIRMNQVILTYLLGLPYSEADDGRDFTVGMAGQVLRGICLP